MYSKHIIIFLYQLYRSGIKLWINNDKIQVFVPEGGSLLSDQQELIKNNREQIISCLCESKIFSKEDAEFAMLKNSETQTALSFTQERFWFLDRYEKGTNAYNIPMIFEVPKDTKIDLVLKSIYNIVERHQVLRTLIKEDAEGNGYQQILDIQDSHFEIESKYFSTIPELTKYLLERVNYVFDLSREIPIKVAVYEINHDGDEKQTYLSIVFHHIAFDGWSIDIFMEELEKFYTFHLNQHTEKVRDISLSELHFQYKDFAMWQRHNLDGEMLSLQLDYWTQKLTGYENLNLRTDRPRSEKLDYQGKNIFFQLNEEVSYNLRKLSREFEISLYTLLLGAYCLTLRFYSNQDDIVIGTPVSNRHYNQIKNLIGCFVNSLPLRFQISTKVSVKEFMKDVGKQILEAQEHQDLPFEKLVDKLKVEKDTSRHPIFQVIFSVHSFGSGIFYQKENLITDSGKFLRPYNKGINLYEVAKFDLSTVIDDSELILKGAFNYSTALYNEDSINKFIHTYKSILFKLSTLANNTESQESTKIIDLFNIEDSQLQLIQSWNDTEASYSTDKVIYELFEAQAQITPDNLAVAAKNIGYSYKEINEEANQLAHLLLKAKVRQGDPVIILQDRSVNTIISLLATLKAGAFYVPLDPKWPYERILSCISLIPDSACIIATYSQSNTVQQLQWEIPSLTKIIYIDECKEYLKPEKVDTIETIKFWNYISDSASNEIAAGGFFSIYDGKLFSAPEVEQYKNHVVNLFVNDIDTTKTVLEIGCGAGLIMNEVINKVAHYTGVDPSLSTLQKNSNYLKEREIKNATLINAFAHEFEKFHSQYDIIILASTIQFFPGYNYLASVIKEAINALKPNGKIIIADILDFRQRQSLQKSLLEKRSASQNIELTGLYIDENFFHFNLSNIETQIIHKREDFNNELRFRYDVIISKIKDEITPYPIIPKGCSSPYTAWHKSSLLKTKPAIKVHPTQIAYIIFTSGSTGIPKGVKISHTAVVNIIEWVNKTFTVGNHDKLLFVTSFTFDLSVYDIFGVLSTGASLYLIEDSKIMDMNYIVNKIIEEGITFWDSTPMLLSQVVDLFIQKKIINNSLRLIFLSGDWIPLDLPTKLRSIFPNAEIISLGGATEATIWSNYYIIKNIEPNWQSIPYGKPIQNTKYYILDNDLKLCNIGVPGQIAISGVCVAQGYNNNSEKNNQSFLKNHIEPDNKNLGYERLYLTGDMGRYFPDGNIELLGRIDHQIKVRGYRVELGEIESAILAYGQIEQCVVLVKQNPLVKEDKYLVVFYKSANKLKTSNLLKYLKSKLPSYIVPSHFVHIDLFPLSPNGKLNREKLLSYKADIIDAKNDYVAPINEIQKIIADIWKNLLGLDKVGIKDNFFDIGGNSILLMKMIAAFPEKIKAHVNVIDVFKNPTISELCDFINNYDSNFELTKNLKSKSFKTLPCSPINRPKNIEIAIIGMAGRFPQADSIEELWENLKNGRNCTTKYTRKELQEKGVASDLLDNPNYVKSQNKINNVKGFDAKFFGFTPIEAKMLDPQQRIFLECCWEALENASYNPIASDKKIGIYAGGGFPDYYINHVLPSFTDTDMIKNFQAMIYNGNDFMSSRVAYKLNCKGPAVTIQTACSSSLVAVHQACEALIANNCDIALAGGVSLGSLKEQGYLYQEGMIMSPDGNCRAFDHLANGTVFGQGAGVVVLKLLEHAKKDGDHIYAIIKSSSINNDGSEKIGFTAPSIRGQVDVICDALKKAEINAESITYVEAHGTGTKLGDPIEIEALTEAFKDTTNQKEFCAIGSIKTNIGHLDAAAGIAGLIKTSLCLYYKILVPSLHYQRPNPQINFKNSPFYVNTKLKQWPSNGYTRHAGISSFGIGGTNAHIILSENEELMVSSSSNNSYELLTLSANSKKSLDDLAINLAIYLRSKQKISLTEVVYNMNVGRHHLSHRVSYIARTINEVIEFLEAPLKEIECTGDKDIVFFFGQETPIAIGIFSYLYENINPVTVLVDKCLIFLENNMHLPITMDHIFNEVKESSGKEDFFLLINFIQSICLAEYYIFLGIKPAAIICRGLGEYVAAYLSKIISLEDCLMILCKTFKFDKHKDIKPHKVLNGKHNSSQELINKIVCNKFNIPVITYSAKGWIQDSKISRSEYWVNHPFMHDFDQVSSLKTLCTDKKFKNSVILNFSGLSLCKTALQEICLYQGDNGIQDILNSLKELYLMGANINWCNYYSHNKISRIPLPTYPFDRTEHWIPHQAS